MARVDAAYGTPTGQLSWGWLCALIVAVLYGSLIPFDIDLAYLGSSNVFDLHRLSFHVATREDLITNLLLYIPIGLAVALCGTRRRSRGLVRIPVALVVGMAVSLVAEWLQTGIAVRIASWTDVALNSVGAACGAILGIAFVGLGRATAGPLRREFSRKPFAVAASFLTVAVLAYNLAPFDFITSTRSLQASFLRARWDLTTIRHSTHGDPPFALLVAQLTAAAWFTLLGYLRALAERSSGRAPMQALASAAKHTLILIVVIEFMQLFTPSHAFDLAVIMLRLLAAVLGAWVAVFMVDRFTRSRWQVDQRAALPTLALVLIAAFHVAGMFVASLDSSLWLLPTLDPASVRWIPFESLWHQPMPRAGYAVASTLVGYGTLTVILAVVARRASIGRHWLAAGAGVMLVAVGVETLQCASVYRTADVTGPILALLAVLGIARISATLRTLLLR